MPRRIQLQATIDISLAQHKNLLDTLEAWSADPNHAYDRCDRNGVADQTTVRVYVDGVGKDEIEARLADLDDAVAGLPGDWPLPSDVADIRAV